MSKFIKLLTNPQEAFKSHNDLITLINTLILENRNSYERLPQNVQTYLNANVYGTRLLKHPNQADLFGKTMFGQSELNQEIKQLIEILKNLLITHVGLEVQHKRVNEAQQKELEIKIHSIGSPFIELYKTDKEFLDKLNELKNKKIIDAYALLEQLINNIFTNKKYFTKITGVKSAEEITYQQLEDIKQENETNKLTDVLYLPKRYLLNSSSIVIQIIFNALNNARNTDQIIKDLTGKNKSDKLKEKVEGFKNKNTGILASFKTQKLNSSDIVIINIRKIDMLGGSLNNLEDDDVYYQKYLKYKAKYNRLKAKLI